MERPKLVNNQVYHIYNRGVEKRKIFLKDRDYLRFIHDLFEFNDLEPASRLYLPRRAKTSTVQISEVELPQIDADKEPRKLLVEILAFCLMPNHYHLLLRQKREKGVTEFMRKLNTGYTNYFNQMYERVGHLLQGRYKVILINRDSYFIHLPYYIHLNPLDLVEPGWNEKKIRDVNKAIKFLESYRWSSHLDYAGKKNFPSVTSRNFLQEILGKPKEYQRGIKEYLRDFDSDNIRGVCLE